MIKTCSRTCSRKISSQDCSHLFPLNMKPQVKPVPDLFPTCSRDLNS